MTDRNDELLPCPFCGVSILPPPFENLKDGPNDKPMKCWTISHWCEGLNWQIIADGQTKEAVVKAWNTRHG